MHRFLCSLSPFTRTAQTGRRLVPVLALLLLCASGRMAAAAILNVPTQYATIQAAVNAAQSGDTVLIADGTYSGDGNRDIDFNGKNITVTSQHGAASTIIDCGGHASSDGSGNHRGFYIHRGETSAVVSGLTVKNGYDVYVSGVTDSGNGGGICIDSSSASIQNCTLSGNTADIYGGGIYSLNYNPIGNGTIILTNCYVMNNTAYGSGGGIYNYNNNGNGTMTLTNCHVMNNTAYGYGGGVYNLTYNSNSSNTARITMTGCGIAGNMTQTQGGGGVYNDNNNGTVAMTDCTVFNNIAKGQGNGGGVCNNNDTASGMVTLTDCTVSTNTAQGNGGGVYNLNANGSNNATVAMTNCIVLANTAQGSGGGVYNLNANSLGTATVTLTNCTIWGNTGRGCGGVFNNANANSNGNGTITLVNSILFGDAGGEILNDTQSVSNAVARRCDIQGGYAGPDNINADPLFADGANDDLHLQIGSPCIGAGTSSGAPATDKDGNIRPNPPSIGAYEGPARGHTHLLWNNSDGRVMLWSIAADGTFTLNGFGPYTDNAPGNIWHATAVATGADGKSHLLWNNTDGRVMLWTVDDAGNFSLAGYGPYTDNAPQNKWSAIGVSVGPDNTVHLLWSNTDHRAMLWNVAPDFTFTLAGYGPYTDNAPGNLWSATALATGPDNVSRIVWNNTDNRVMLWDVNADYSFTLAGYGPYTDGAPQNLWSAAGVSVGPDNLTHLLWSNTDRRAMFWDVAPDFTFTLAGYGPYTDNGANNLWSAAAVATGPDGLSHILWGNTDYRAMLWGVDNSFNFTVAGYGPYTDNAPQNQWSATAVSAGP